MNKKTRVLYVAKFIPFYREGILKGLASRFSCQFICQEQDFGVGRTPKLPEMKQIPMSSIIGKFDWIPLRREIDGFRPEVIISELGLSFLTVFWLVLAKRLYGYKLAFWTHGLEGPRKAGKMWLSDYVRKWVLEQADAVIYYTKGCSDASGPHLRNDLTYVAPNTLDSQGLNKSWRKLSEGGIQFKKSVVFIGRLVESKRVRELLRLSEILQRMDSSVRVQIAGDGPLKKELECETERLGLPVDFLGAVTSDDDKADLLGSALAGVCLGRVGLNIVDNISFGLPLLTLDSQPISSAHAPEVDYLVPNETGWRCKDLFEVAEVIVELENDLELRMNCQAYCRSYFEENCSMSRQLQGLVEAVDSVSRRQ